MHDDVLAPGAAKLTLSIVSHGHGKLVERLIGDLAMMPTIRNARIVITLNIPEAFSGVECWSGLDILVQRNAMPRGFGANHNAAFRHCCTPWFAVLNPDLRLPADPFPALVSAASRRPGCGVVAPVILDPSGRLEDSLRQNLTPWSLLKRAAQRMVGQRRLSGVDPAADSNGFVWAAGMFLLFPAAAYRSIGGFDERFYLYCEDYDICARLRRAGLDVLLAPEGSAVHDARRESQRSLKHLRWHLTSLSKVWTSSAFWWVCLRGHSPRAPMG